MMNGEWRTFSLVSKDDRYRALESVQFTDDDRLGPALRPTRSTRQRSSVLPFSSLVASTLVELPTYQLDGNNHHVMMMMIVYKAYDI